MTLFQEFLDFCSKVVFLSGMLYLLIFVVYAIATEEKYKVAEAISNAVRNALNKKGETLLRLFLTVLFSLFLIGLVNTVLDTVYSSEQIGAFYESSWYETDYEALLSLDGKPIFCIVRLHHNTHRFGSYFEHNYQIIDNIHLPYGITRNIEPEDYHPQWTDNSLSFSNDYDTVYCAVTLIRPATSTSYATLKTEILSHSGDFCGSKKSDKFHFYECRYAREIEKENFIYFDSMDEACLFGYDMCDYCRNHYF